MEKALAEARTTMAAMTGAFNQRGGTLRTADGAIKSFDRRRSPPAR